MWSFNRNRKCIRAVMTLFCQMFSNIPQTFVGMVTSYSHTAIACLVDVSVSLPIFYALKYLTLSQELSLVKRSPHLKLKADEPSRSVGTLEVCEISLPGFSLRDQRRQKKTISNKTCVIRVMSVTNFSNFSQNVTCLWKSECSNLKLLFFKLKSVEDMYVQGTAILTYVRFSVKSLKCLFDNVTTRQWIEKCRPKKWRMLYN